MGGEDVALFDSNIRLFDLLHIFFGKMLTAPFCTVDVFQVLYFSFHITFYFFSTASQREILHFLLHYIYLTALVILQIAIFAHKTYEEFIKCAAEMISRFMQSQLATILIIV